RNHRSGLFYACLRREWLTPSTFLRTYTAVLLRLGLLRLVLVLWTSMPNQEVRPEDRPASRAGRKKGRAKAEPRVSRGSDARTPEEVEITHPDKVLYPQERIIKGDVAEYYRVVAPRLLPFL